MPGWVGGRDGERAWDRAKKIILKQYPQLKGVDDEDAPKARKDKFYALTTTVYKSICKGEGYECAPMKSESMGELLVRLELLEGSEINEEKLDPKMLLGLVLLDAANMMLQWSASNKAGDLQPLVDKSQATYAKLRVKMHAPTATVSLLATKLLKKKDRLMSMAGIAGQKDE